jgi:anhydro-N-acetylmuramic acid kinase
VNTVLNFYANQLGLDYDDKGQLAGSGKLNSDLLNELNALEYYKKPFPKSLGFEFVKETILPLIEKYNIPIEDKLNTFTEHITFQIAVALPNKKGKLLATGGGAYNDFLIERLKFWLPELEIIIPDKKTIEFKEALIFALLGVLKLRYEINVLSSVTGAKKDHSSGMIFNNHK